MTLNIKINLPLFLLAQIQISYGKFIGGFVFPHGGITVDPDVLDWNTIPANKLHSKEESKKLHEAMRQSASKLISLLPEILILSTPHGLTLVDNFLLLGNHRAAGSAGEARDEEISVDIAIDVPTSYSMYRYLKKMKHPIEVANLGSSHQPMTLLWAEVIPLWFILTAAKEANITSPNILVLGMPINANQTQLLNFGRDFHAFSQQGELKGKRVVVAISGDLSHYHSNDSNSPYEFHEKAIPFDLSIKRWAQIDIKNETIKKSDNELLNVAGGLSELVGSCGYSGLVFLQGILKESLAQKLPLNSHFYYYAAPTYFGMIVANWII